LDRREKQNLRCKGTEKENIFKKSERQKHLQIINRKNDENLAKRTYSTDSLFAMPKRKRRRGILTGLEFHFERAFKLL